MDRDDKGFVEFPSAQAVELELAAPVDRLDDGSEERGVVQVVRDRIKAIELPWPVVQARDFVRKVVDKLGIPGLLLYNVVDGLSRAVPTYFLIDGTDQERMMTAGIVGGVAIITNVTFWTAIGLTAFKVRRVFSERREKKLIALVEEAYGDGTSDDEDTRG